MFQRSPRSSGKDLSGVTNISSPQTDFELYYKLGLVDIKVESSRLDTLCASSPSSSLSSSPPAKEHAGPIQGYFKLCFISDCFYLTVGFFFFF